LVENLDRVSRQNAWDALPFFQQIINEGVVIVTLQDGREYRREEMRENPMRIIESLLVMIRANEESQTKSRRVREAWGRKRSKAGTARLTAKCPSWLLPSPDGEGFTLVHNKAAIVRRVFDMAHAGMGPWAIAQTLNREGVPPLSADRSKRPAKHWHRTTVIKLLASPSAMGTLVPHTVEYDASGKRRRVATADAVEGYYPAAVTAELFHAVNGLRRDTPAPRGRNAIQPVRSFLAGLAQCPSCGGIMTRVTKGKRSKPVLVCSRAKNGAGCDYRSVRQDAIERAIVHHASVLSDPPAGNATLADALAKARAAYDALTSDIADTGAELSRTHSPALRDRLAMLEAALPETKATLDAAAARAFETSDAVIMANARRLYDALTVEGETDPHAINLALRRVVRGVTVDHETGSLVFLWKHGPETITPYDFGFEVESRG
jgi:hypothetical protein